MLLLKLLIVLVSTPYADDWRAVKPGSMQNNLVSWEFIIIATA
jgi:signal peptidase I